MCPLHMRLRLRILRWKDFPGLSLWTHGSLKETSLVKGSLGPQTWPIYGYCKTIKGSPCRLMVFYCLKIVQIVQRSLPCKTRASLSGPSILVTRLITRVKLQHNLVREVLDQLRENEGMPRLTWHVFARSALHTGLSLEMLDQGEI